MRRELVRRMRAAVETLAEVRTEVATEGRQTHLPEWFDRTLGLIADDWEQQLRSADQDQAALVDELALDLCMLTFQRSYWENNPSIRDAFRFRARILIGNGWRKGDPA